MPKVNPNAPAFKLAVWVGTTLLSIGVVYGSMKTRMDNLERQMQEYSEKIDRIDKNSALVPALQQLLLQHMGK